MKPTELTADERSTIRMALTCWIIRCETEAKTQREFAVQMPHHAAKCEANARASDDFAASARDLLNGRKV
jgi:hypothetical protein